MKVPVVPGLSKMQIEAKATAILREIQPEVLLGNGPVEIEEFYEFYIPDYYGIKTHYTDLSPLGADILGYTDASKKLSYVDKTLSDSEDAPIVRRFRATVGHEAGHCIYHVAVLNSFRSSSMRAESEGLYRAEYAQVKPYENPEWQAWEFARAFLMPRPLVIRCCEKGWSVRDMADFFDVNPAFMEVRLRKLNIKPF